MVLQTNLPFSLWNLWMTYYLTTWTWVTDEIEITEHLALRCGDFHWLSGQATCKAIISIIRWAVEGHKSQGSGRQRASKTGLHIRVGLQRKYRLALETYGGCNIDLPAPWSTLVGHFNSHSKIHTKWVVSWSQEKSSSCTAIRKELGWHWWLIKMEVLVCFPW